jgi:hypothetical protein
MNYCTKLPVDQLAPVRRIIVIGDIHGDWEALQKALLLGQVIDRSNRWVGADTHVVQLGDFIDRKTRVGVQTDERSESQIINYLFWLKKKAQAAGGDVHIILGNHEIMNFQNDFRYVSPQGFTDFNGDRQRAFRRGGDLAQQMICNTVSILQIGQWVFSHAGILNIGWTIPQINSHVRDFLNGNIGKLEDKIYNYFTHRGYGTEDSCLEMRSNLSRLNPGAPVTHMVIGHTVQSGITPSCKGTLWKADVGLSGAFGTSRPVEILEIKNGTNGTNWNKIKILK